MQVVNSIHLHQLLVIAFGLENAGQEVTFSDVPQDSWANQYVSILASNGVTNGDGNGSFGMDELLKIKELKTFIERLQSR